MNKFPSRVSAARRNAETLLRQSRKQDSTFQVEQERVQQATSLKTARLRELRLAKEAEDKAAAAAAPPPAPKAKRTKKA